MLQSMIIKSKILLKADLMVELEWSAQILFTENLNMDTILGFLLQRTCGFALW